ESTEVTDGHRDSLRVFVPWRKILAKKLNSYRSGLKRYTAYVGGGETCHIGAENILRLFPPLIRR
ncbi:MAG: hypothetical protein NZM11_12140, partial [Anaerolineales bacterium]|nr:hypothetical protein [Anaerolineales bacterium]